MIKELDDIVLAQDLPEYGLAAGDLGTIVMIHEAGKGYEVEFAALDGETIAVATLSAAQIQPVQHHQIAHVRDLAAA